jgi:hypothetical protein
MADFPSYAHIQFQGYAEDPKPSVLRTEMERGAPKQSVVNSQDLVAMSASLLFQSSADAASFIAWHRDTIGKVGTFNLTHPRTGSTITAWFREGYIGQLVPLGPGFSPCSRDCVIEFME